MTENDAPPPELSLGGGADRYFPTVYNDLRQLAQRRLKNERSRSLRPTELVHEVFLRLGRDENLVVHSREHLLALSGMTMRRILVEYARRRRAQKRGGGLLRVTLEDDIAIAEDPTVDLLALDEALSRLEKRDPEAAAVVQHRFFAGLTESETGEVMGMSERWVRGQWAFARAWLLRELSKRT